MKSRDLLFCWVDVRMRVGATAGAMPSVHMIDLDVDVDVGRLHPACEDRLGIAVREKEKRVLRCALHKDLAGFYFVSDQLRHRIASSRNI